MSRRSVSTTHLDGLRLSGVGGRTAYDSWDQIRQIVVSRFGEETAEVFAEPVVHGEEVTWFISGEGDIKPFSELDADAQIEILSSAKIHTDKIRAYADTLKTEGASQTDLQLAGMLNAALTTPEASPSRELLYSVGGRPVIVLWGAREDTQTAAADPLQEFFKNQEARIAKGEPASPAPDQASAVRTTPVYAALAPVGIWRFLPLLLWLLFVAVLLWIFLMLVAGCSLFGAQRPFLGYCPGANIAEVSELDRLVDEERDLRNAMLALRENAYRSDVCQTPEPEEDLDERLREANAGEGDVTVSILWDTRDDLDLHIVCPSGAFINYQNIRACGGVLDVDQNRKLVSARGNPVENVVFSREAMQEGRYTIRVHNYRASHNNPVPFSLRVRIDGEDQMYEGAVKKNQVVDVATIQHPNE